FLPFFSFLGDTDKSTDAAAGELDDARGGGDSHRPEHCLQRQARLPAHRARELAYAEVVHPAAQYEDIARDQHRKGIDEKSASAKTQVRVGCDLLGLQAQILVEENRLVQAND